VKHLFKIVFLFVGIIVFSNMSVFSDSINNKNLLLVNEENPRFQIYRLEIRLPRKSNYKVPVNIDLFRESLGLTEKYIVDEYRKNCKELGIKLFQTKESEHMYRRIYKLWLMWLGVTSNSEYEAATNHFFESVEKQLTGNSYVLNKFNILFKKEDGYIKKLKDHVEHNILSAFQVEKMRNIAKHISSLQSYNKMFEKNPYLLENEWSHHFYVFYMLSHYQERREKRFEKIIKDLKEKYPDDVKDTKTILNCYSDGQSWLLQAARFFLYEKWFYNDSNDNYVSMEDLLIDFWKPILGFLPSIDPVVYRFGEVDGTARTFVPYLEYYQLLKPLNKEAINFLKNKNACELDKLFDSIRDSSAKDTNFQFAEGEGTLPLRWFINTLHSFEKAVQRGAHAYDFGCPVTMLISNMPHEIAHYLHTYGRRYWKCEFDKNQKIYYQVKDSYISEGIAELCQIMSVKPILDKFPMLRHDNLLKHYIFSHEQDTHNHHTWGFFWLKTIYNILDNNFKNTFFMASRPGKFFDQLLKSQDLQKEKVLKISQNNKTYESYKREKGRRKAFTYIFPSCVIEYEKDSFILKNFVFNYNQEK